MSIKNHINAIVWEPGKYRRLLAPKTARASIPAKVGKGKYVAPVTPGVATGGSRKEVITVFSHLIITADGAFERPLGWPSNGDYPSGTPIPSPLPASLKNISGTLSLDTQVQYYEQKRAHLVSYLLDGSLVEDSLFVPFAVPFLGAGYYSGIERTGTWAPLLQKVWLNDGNATTSARATVLTGLGILDAT